MGRPLSWGNLPSPATRRVRILGDTGAGAAQRRTALRNDDQTQPDPRALFLHAARYDTVLYRAFLRVLGTYQPAHHVFTDPPLLARVDHLRPERPPQPPDPLDRSGLEQLLGN